MYINNVFRKCPDQGFGYFPEKSCQNQPLNRLLPKRFDEGFGLYKRLTINLFYRNVEFGGNLNYPCLRVVGNDQYNPYSAIRCVLHSLKYGTGIRSGSAGKDGNWRHFTGFYVRICVSRPWSGNS